MSVVREEGGRRGEGGGRVVCDTIEDKESIKKVTTNIKTFLDLKMLLSYT